MKERMLKIIHFSLLFLIYIPWTSGNNCSEDCFYDSPESCEKIDGPKCFTSSIRNDALVCCHLNQTNLGEYLNRNNRTVPKVRSLHILNSNFDVFNLDITGWIKEVCSLAITNGQMNEFRPLWTKRALPKCLNLSSNSLKTVGNFTGAEKIRYFDFSNNSLSKIPKLPKLNVTIDISDNKLWCNTTLSQLQENNNWHFVNPNNTWCMLATNGWVTTGRILLTELQKNLQMKINCSIPNCDCDVLRVNNVNLMDSKFWIKVNCSNRGLQQLPSPLPDNCFTLDVSHNNISSLRLIRNDSSYGSLSELYAQHNNITSIDELEGSKFVQSFTRLNLRYNNITSISTHVFRYSFDRASQRELSLGYNYIECDCNVAKSLKSWLTWNDIKDSEEVFCSDKNHVKIVNLDPSDVCREERSLTDHIYYVIAAEVLLLTSLIAKVSYDYWVFKSSGYLPWPASRMPKLPCDWLCE